MLLSKDGCRTFETIGRGSEDWRAVTILPMKEGWLYATDAERQRNVIALIEANSNQRRVIGQLPGPVYYSYKWGEEALFSVTAERCDTMKNPRGSLFRVFDNRVVEQLIDFPKDIAATRMVWRLFMPGTLNFPGGSGHPDHFYLSGVALRGIDNRVLVGRYL